VQKKESEVRSSIIAALIAITCTAAHANTSFGTTKCSVNGQHFKACAVEQSMGQGNIGNEVTLPDGRKFVIQNFDPSREPSIPDGRWFINGKLAHEVISDERQGCWASRQISICYGGE
jgi:hypothetical protein